MEKFRRNNSSGGLPSAHGNEHSPSVDLHQRKQWVIRDIGMWCRIVVARLAWSYDQLYCRIYHPLIKWRKPVGFLPKTAHPVECTDDMPTSCDLYGLLLLLLWSSSVQYIYNCESDMVTVPMIIPKLNLLLITFSLWWWKFTDTPLNKIWCIYTLSKHSQW